MMMNGWSSGKSDGGGKTKEARQSTSGSTIDGSRAARKNQVVAQKISESTKSKIVIKEGKVALVSND